MGIFSIYQVILLSFSLVFIYNRTVRFLKRERGQTVYKLVVTYVLWAGIAVVAVFPNDVGVAVRELGLGENFNTLIFLVFVIVFVLIFRTISLIEKMEQQITELVRKEALRSIYVKDKKG